MSQPTNNIVWHTHQVGKSARAAQKQQRPCLLWFTGLSGSGKSTLAGKLDETLYQMGYHTYLLDGDNVRHGLCKDLGFSTHDRKENIRRIGELSALMVDAGLITLAAFISPHIEERASVRALLADDEFIEVFVDTPLDICEARDPKGLYQKARKGEIRGFTGIDSEYEAPTAPELHLHNGPGTLDANVEKIISALVERGIIASQAV